MSCLKKEKREHRAITKMLFGSVFRLPSRAELIDGGPSEYYELELELGQGSWRSRQHADSLIQPQMLAPVRRRV